MAQSRNCMQTNLLSLYILWLICIILVSLGLLIPAICIVSVGHVDCSSPYVAVGIMMFCMGAKAFTTPSVYCNDLEIAPPFAGTIHGITNMAGNLSGMAIPSIVAKLTEEVSTVKCKILMNLITRFYREKMLYLYFNII